MTAYPPKEVNLAGTTFLTAVYDVDEDKFLKDDWCIDMHDGRCQRHSMELSRYEYQSTRAAKKLRIEYAVHIDRNHLSAAQTIILRHTESTSTACVCRETIFTRPDKLLSTISVRLKSLLG